MDSIIRGLTVYVFLLVIFRFAGTRMMAQMTSFDLILLLIISETTQEAMIAGDHSITNCFLLIMTLVGATVLLSFLKMKFPKLSDQDLNFDEINKAEMFRQLEVKLALTAKELQGIMNTPINDLREKLP